jgi:hypothetical protein
VSRYKSKQGHKQNICKHSVIKERGFIAFSIMAPNDNLTAVLHGINDMRLVSNLNG